MSTTGLPELAVPATEKLGDWYSRLKKTLPNVAPNVLNRVARGVAPDKPSEQQMQEWSTANRINRFYNNPRYQAKSPKDKERTEYWLYKNKIAPQFQASGRKIPSYPEWVAFRNDPNFQKNQMKMFDYFDTRQDPKTFAKDIGWRAARSFTKLAENVYTLGMVHPEKASQTDYAVMNALESLKGLESQKIDKYSAVNASWHQRFAEGIANQSDTIPLFAALSPISKGLGVISKAGEIEGTLGSFDWAANLAKTAKGRFVLNRLLNAVDQFTAGTISGMSPWQQAIGTLFPRGMREEVGAGIQKIFKIETSENTGEQILKNVLNPEQKEAVQKLGANMGTILGPQATLATMHAAASDVEGTTRDTLSNKLVGIHKEVYNGIARNLGYRDFNSAPENIRFKIVNTAVHEMLEANKNPAAIDPKLTEFMVQHNIAENAEKFPEYARNSEALEQAARKTGHDSARITAEETYKEATKDLPQTQYRPATEAEIAAKQKAAGMDPRATVLLPWTRLGDISGGFAKRGYPYLPYPPVQLPPEEGKLFGLDPHVKTPTPQQYPYMPTERGIPPTVTPMSTVPTKKPKWGTWDVKGYEKWLAEQKAKTTGEAPQAIKPKQPKVSLGPGAAHKEDPAFRDFLRHISESDLPIQNELHQYVKTWANYRERGEVPKEVKQNIIEVIKDNLPSGINERYITPRLLDKWASELKYHITKMEITGHTPAGGDPRGVFRSTKLGGYPTIWQEQLHGEYETATGVKQPMRAPVQKIEQKYPKGRYEGKHLPLGAED